MPLDDDRADVDEAKMLDRRARGIIGLNRLYEVCESDDQEDIITDVLVRVEKIQRDRTAANVPGACDQGPNVWLLLTELTMALAQE